MKKKIFLVLRSVVVGYASSLQACKPASLVVPPCQDIAYHIPNQEDNTLLLTPQLNYPSLFQKKVTFYTLRIRSREHVDYILLLLLLPPTSSCIVTSAERGKCKSRIDSQLQPQSLNESPYPPLNLSTSIVQTSLKVKKKPT